MYHTFIAILGLNDALPSNKDNYIELGVLTEQGITPFIDGINTIRGSKYIEPSLKNTISLINHSHIYESLNMGLFWYVLGDAIDEYRYGAAYDVYKLIRLLPNDSYRDNALNDLFKSESKKINLLIKQESYEEAYLLVQLNNRHANSLFNKKWAHSFYTIMNNKSAALIKRLKSVKQGLNRECLLHTSGIYTQQNSLDQYRVSFLKKRKICAPLKLMIKTN